MQKLIADLRREHGHLIRRLYELSLNIDALRRGAGLCYEELLANLDDLTGEPDRFHHPREEVLFDLLCERLGEPPELVLRLRREHRSLRQMGVELRDRLSVAAAGEPVSRNLIVSLCHDYIHAQRWHIAQEETGLYRLAEASLEPEDWQRLDERLRERGLMPSDALAREP